jgi:peptide/nickel transport system permease protein
MRRLPRALLTALVVSLVAFGLLRATPGDPVQTLLGDLATPELVADYRARLGLAGSTWEQLSDYYTGLFTGDLGQSIVTREPVSATIARTLPVTGWLVALSVLLGLLVAIPLAVVVSVWRQPWLAYLFRVSTATSLAIPSFFTGLVATLIFAIRLRWAPTAGYEPGFPGNLRYLWLPALVNCLVLVPILSRVLHSSLLDTLDEEFVETAIVRGLPRRTRLWRYVVRPALPPTVALATYMIGQLLSSAVIVESIFGIPGIGKLLVDSVFGRDYPMVQGIVLVIGTIVVFVSLGGEIINGWLDPRTTNRAK